MKRQQSKPPHTAARSPRAQQTPPQSSQPSPSTQALRSPAARAFDALRADAGDYGNHAIDEFVAGRLTRRELLRYAGVLGLSSLALASAGLIMPRSARAQDTPGKPGNQTIRVAHLMPAGAVDPLTVTKSEAKRS